MSSKKLTQLSSRIKGIRERFSLSQVELAQRLGVTDSYISQIEAGKKTEISEQLDRLIAYEFEGADRIRESGIHYGLDDVSEKIVDMLKDMDDGARRDVLKYVEAQKLWLKKHRKEGA